MHGLLCVGGRRQLIEGVVGSVLVVIDQPPVRCPRVVHRAFGTGVQHFVPVKAMEPLNKAF